MLKRLITIVLNITIVIAFLQGSTQKADANEIVKLKGDIRLRKNGENEFQPANFLDSLSYEDEFQVGTNSSLMIRCSNTHKPVIEQPGTYLVSNYCDEGEATEVLENNIRFRPPTEDLSHTPYIISPRNSSIFPEEITIKWNPVASATSYTVRIDDWEAETTNTEIVYTGETLNPGFHFVSVEADNGESSGDIGFTIINLEQAQLIQQGVTKIRQEGLEIEAEKFILARFYRNKGFHMSAIEILEDLVATGNQTKNVYLLLINLYEQVGLESEAYEISQQVIK
ncbi:MAG: hypothetical protein AAFQ80_23505 [Cyanobacteria bacterium J06621_8]